MATGKGKTKAEKKMDMKSKKTMPKDYDFLEDVRSEKLYKANITVRDRRSRKILENECALKGESTIMPGQLIMFKYFEPKTEDELEYYDALPVTVFFGEFKNKKGEKRVLGFNIHYYPPSIRYKLMDRIIQIFKPLYKDWQDPIKKEISHFEYSLFMAQLKKHKIDFGVRMYDPKLMGGITPIPVSHWSLAVFTEGAFRKRTRTAIMNYWKQWIESKKY